MPVPMEATCYQSLWNMSVNLGRLVESVERGVSWDPRVAISMASDLVELVDVCVLSTECTDPALALMAALGDILEETGDTPLTTDQLEPVGASLAGMTKCLHDIYQLRADFTRLDAPWTDWPDDRWLATWKPLRVKATR